MTISEAAVYAGCSRRFIEKLLASGGFETIYQPNGKWLNFEIERHPDGTIDAGQLKALVVAKRLCPYRSPGRMIGTRYQTKVRRRPIKSVQTDYWRFRRSLSLIGKTNSVEYLKGIVSASLQRAKALGAVFD